MVYSFVRAMTAVSAVIFLVSGDYNLATVYIVGRADVGEYGIAIVYSADAGGLHDAGAWSRSRCWSANAASAAAREAPPIDGARADATTGRSHERPRTAAVEVPLRSASATAR